MSREREEAPVETKEKEREKSPPPRGRSRSGSRGRRSPPPRRGSRSPPRRRYSSRSRSRSPPRRRYSRSPPRRRYSRSRSRSPPRRRSRSRSPPRRDYGRPNRDYGRNFRDAGATTGDYRGDWRRRGERPLAKPSNVLGVFGLAPETDKEELEVIFKKYGKLKEIVLVKDRDSGLSKGFCFVYYEDQQDAADAKAELDGSSVEGRKIRVDYSLTTKPHEPTPGQYMGNKRWDRTRQGFSDERGGYSDRRRSRSRSR